VNWLAVRPIINSWFSENEKDAVILVVPKMMMISLMFRDNATESKWCNNNISINVYPLNIVLGNTIIRYYESIYERADHSRNGGVQML